MNHWRLSSTGIYLILEQEELQIEIKGVSLLRDVQGIRKHFVGCNVEQVK